MARGALVTRLEEVRPIRTWVSQPPTYRHGGRPAKSGGVHAYGVVSSLCRRASPTCA